MAMNTRKTRSVRVCGACDYCIGTEVLAKQEGRLCPGPCHRDGTKTLFYAAHNRWPISQLWQVGARNVESTQPPVWPMNFWPNRDDGETGEGRSQTEMR